MIKNRALFVLTLSSIYIGCADIDTTNQMTIRRTNGFHIPSHYSPKQSEDLIQGRISESYSVNIGRQRPSRSQDIGVIQQTESNTVLEYKDNPARFPYYHPVDKVIIGDSDSDSLASGDDNNKYYPLVYVSEAQSQTDDPVKIEVKDKSVQTDFIPRKPQVITKTVEKEKKLSFCDLIAKLCCCEWE